MSDKLPSLSLFLILSQCGGGAAAGGPRVAVVTSGGVPEATRPELMEQDSKDSAQSVSTSSSQEIQPEYKVRHKVC